MNFFRTTDTTIWKPGFRDWHSSAISGFMEDWEWTGWLWDPVPWLFLLCFHLWLRLGGLFWDAQKEWTDTPFVSLHLCPLAEFQYIENSLLKVQVQGTYLREPSPCEQYLNKQGINFRSACSLRARTFLWYCGSLFGPARGTPILLEAVKVSLPREFW